MTRSSSDMHALRCFVQIIPKGKIWFLEANCNPQFHPAFYDTMLDGIFCNEL